MVGFTPRANIFLAVSKKRSFAGQNDKEIEGLGRLLGICPEFARNSELARNLLGILTCFHASFFPFYPFCWPPLFLPFSRHVFAIFSPSRSALFCPAKGTAQSLERGGSGMDLSRKFGKEIPSPNLREKRPGIRSENGPEQPCAELSSPNLGKSQSRLKFFSRTRRPQETVDWCPSP